MPLSDNLNEGEPDVPNVYVLDEEADKEAKKSNVLVMISTHGTWSTTDKTKADLLRKYYNKACDAVEQKLESLEKSPNKDFKEQFQLYLGYDGNCVQPAGATNSFTINAD